MKCPKCGYLGFETTDRCRNCQYDFSLAPFASEQELALNDGDRRVEGGDFDLPTIKRQTDKLNTAALDLDRLFGDADERSVDAAGRIVSIASGEPVRAVEVPPAAEALLRDAATAVEEGPPMAIAAVDEGALPFEDGPIMPPPAARPPLAVRRSTAEVPRNRPRTTRPFRSESLDFDPAASSGATSQEAANTMASLLEIPSLGARVSAGLIDVLLLAGIDIAVLYLTLRVTGLQNTLEDLRVLPPVPFVAFLATLGFGYVAAFTVAGGQTIGKMVLSLRVIGDDGRPLDAAGGMLRALGCMLVPITFGLSYLPAVFTSDRRAIHDRLAGTRVVQE